jgi:hypothetical protein
MPRSGKDRMKPKIGKTPKELFASTEPVAAAPKPAGPGRPPTLEDAWTKVTVVLFDRQIDYLDRLALDVRRATHGQAKRVALTRAGILRALVDALEAAHPAIDAHGPALTLKLPVERIALKPGE